MKSSRRTYVLLLIVLFLLTACRFIFNELSSYLDLAFIIAVLILVPVSKRMKS
ncbi:hypothetical protein [Fictibacillus barbaricus]|uniref:Lipoprotein n=1 Tax=Fictibacillus barbaricus TaxID=182136 RepID=A0ABS2ZHC4_9BACL|nr:hypothetical protein [Fictibacillus barbaricus]MBN3546729.1 hypothetical protein [Fictibacillus barbaricus]